MSLSIDAPIVNKWIEILSGCPDCFSVESKPCPKHLTEMEQARDEYRDLCSRVNKAAKHVQKFFGDVR